MILVESSSEVETEVQKVRLVDVARIISGGTPKTSVAEYWDGEILWATPKDLSGLNSVEISTTPRKITEAGLKSCSAELLPANSVLFSSRAPIGLLAINTKPMSTNQGFKSLVPDTSKLNSRYLYRWLEFEREWLQSLGVGATFKEISKSTMSRVELPLPALPIQRRIAAILDKADHLRTQRSEALAHLDTLTQSIFNGMFGDPIPGRSIHPSVRIGDVLQSATYGTSEKASLDGEIPVLRMNNITYSGELDLADLKYMPAGQPEKFLVRDGDLLFNRTNSRELVGKTCVYRGATDMSYAGYLVRLRLSDLMLPEYLNTFMNLAQTKQLLRNMCKSIVGMANINAKEVQKIQVPLPPLELQQTFAKRVAGIERLKEQHRAQLVELDALFASLQHRAFTGTL